MASTLNTVKIQVPVFRPGPASADWIGEGAAALLAATTAVVSTLATTLAGIAPAALRSQLQDAAAALESERPAAARCLRDVSEKAWVH
jgi:hypothetical protein